MGVEPTPRVVHTRALPQSQFTDIRRSRAAVRVKPMRYARKLRAPGRTHEPRPLTVRLQRIHCAAARSMRDGEVGGTGRNRTFVARIKSPLPRRSATIPELVSMEGIEPPASRSQIGRARNRATSKALQALRRVEFFTI